ncbi:unnamed protein product [Arabidopsis thaliana]|uniref:Uncharacterized protein n=1 Tax=Arabidopsis thaliana TaxID=3702 RepID=A0A5S9WXK9_ARATH|nr:unnamed protein product [Arabidopsis thaliana]
MEILLVTMYSGSIKTFECTISVLGPRINLIEHKNPGISEKRGITLSSEFKKLDTHQLENVAKEKACERKKLRELISSKSRK